MVLIIEVYKRWHVCIEMLLFRCTNYLWVNIANAHKNIQIVCIETFIDLNLNDSGILAGASE